MWYVSQVERNMGRTGTSAVKAPISPLPYPTAAASNKLANVQFSESMPWSNSSPSGLDVPVRRACFPSTLSMVEYIHIPKAKL